MYFRQLLKQLQHWLFVPHVAVYLFAYVIMAKAAVQAGTKLIMPNIKPEEGIVDYERGAYEMVCLGFPLLTLGLILGSWWGKLAWGDYWGWDPKELWSLVSWLVYVAYFHFRYMFGRKYQGANCTWVIGGIVAILITLLWVNLSKLFPGLHSYAQVLLCGHNWYCLKSLKIYQVIRISLNMFQIWGVYLVTTFVHLRFLFDFGRKAGGQIYGWYICEFCVGIVHICVLRVVFYKHQC